MRLSGFDWLVFLLALAGTGGCLSSSEQNVPPPEKIYPSATARSQKGADDLLPATPGARENQEIAVKVVAIINAKATICAEEVETAAYQFLQPTFRLEEPARSQKQREIRQKTLEQLVERELVLLDMQERLDKANPRTMKRLLKLAHDEFRKTWLRSMMKGNGFKDPKAFEKFLAQRGMSLPILKRQWIRNFLSQEYLRNRIIPSVKKISREDLLTYYRTNAKEFELKDRVEWQDIFISAENQGSFAKAKAVADQIVQRAQRGEDFVKLCKAHDEGDSELRDGAGIGQHRGEIDPPEAEAYLFRMKEGQIAPPIKMSSGYHVVRLVKRERAGRKPFDEKVQNEIRNKLRRELAMREMRAFVDRLKRRAVIYYAQ